MQEVIVIESSKQTFKVMALWRAPAIIAFVLIILSIALHKLLWPGYAFLIIWIVITLSYRFTLNVSFDFDKDQIAINFLNCFGEPRVQIFKFSDTQFKSNRERIGSTGFGWKVYIKEISNPRNKMTLSEGHPFRRAQLERIVNLMATPTENA